MPGISFKIRNNLQKDFPGIYFEKINIKLLNIAKNKIIYKINKIKI